MYSQMRFKIKFDLYRSRYAEHHVKKLLAIIIVIIIVRSVELYEHIIYFITEQSGDHLSLGSVAITNKIYELNKNAYITVLVL